MKPSAEEPVASVTRPVDWENFREHLATADKEGRRRWLYPKRPSGRWYRWRTWMSWVLITVMFVGPFVRIQGHPLLMLNIVERRFSILGQMFWPEDTILFAVAMLTFFAGIMIFTTAFGRLWCGWTCPQTVMMEMVFRKLEYLIEGDAAAQKALDAAPWTTGKVARKVLKHGVFLGLSFLIGNTLLSYIIGTEALFGIITDDPRRHEVGLGFMVALRCFSTASSRGSGSRPARLSVPTDASSRRCWTRTRWLSPTITSAAKTGDLGSGIRIWWPGRPRVGAIAWTVVSVWRCVPRASTSGTASRWNASIAPPAWMPAMVSWTSWVDPGA